MRLNSSLVHLSFREIGNFEFEDGMRWVDVKAVLMAEWRRLNDICLCICWIIVAWAVSLD